METTTPKSYILGTKEFGTIIYYSDNTRTLNRSEKSIEAKIFEEGESDTQIKMDTQWKKPERFFLPDRNSDDFELEVAKHLGQELENLGGGIMGFSFENEDGEYLTFGWASQDIGYSYETADGDNIANVYSGSILFTPEEEANWIKNALEQLQFKIPKISYQVIYKCMMKTFGNDISGIWAKQFSKIVADSINKVPQDKQEETLKNHLIVDASWSKKNVTKFMDALKKDGII